MSKFKSFPKKRNGKTIDLDVVKAQYFSSVHIDWKKFCAEYNYCSSNKAFPVRDWKEEKKFKIAEANQEEIDAKLQVFETKQTVEIIKWVEENSKTAKLAQQVCHQYLQEIGASIQADRMKQARGEVVDKKDAFFSKFKTSDLMNILASIKMSQEITSRVLWVNQFNPDSARRRLYPNDEVKKEEGDNETPVLSEMKVTIMNPTGDEQSEKDFTAEIASYYDPVYKTNFEVDENES